MTAGHENDRATVLTLMAETDEESDDVVVFAVRRKRAS